MWLLVRGCLIKMLGNRQVAHRDMTVTNSDRLVTVPLVGISRDICKYTQFSADFERVCAEMDWVLSLCPGCSLPSPVST